LIRDSGVFWRVLGILFLITMMAMPAGAQMEVLVEPSSLAIAETQPYPVVFGVPFMLNLTRYNWTWMPPGDTPTVRTLTLWVAENVTDISVRSSDLGRDDGAYVILASDINATVPGNDLLEEGIASVPISLQLGGIHSGKFSGNLLVTYRGEDEKRGSLKVPVTVTVRDSPWGPLAVLGFGVLLGTGYFHYRSKGKKGDEVRRLYDNLIEIRSRDQRYLNLDPFLFFRAEIDRDLEKTVDRLAISDIDGAEEAINSAWKTWENWRGYRTSLPLQLQRQDDLIKELDNLETKLKPHEEKIGKFQYIPEARQALTKLSRLLQNPGDFTAFAGAFQQFDEGLTKQESAFDTYEQAVKFLERLESTGRDEEKLKKIAAFWLELKQLTPDQDISAVGERIAKEMRLLKPEEKKERKPQVSVEEPDWWDRFGRFVGVRLSWAQIRLGIFGVVTFFLLVIILLITGFKELYLANATFGAGPGDYFTLFLWGLGVAPGSEAAVKAVRDQFGG